MGLVHTGIKKHPISTIKYTTVSLMLWAYFSAGGPGHLIQIYTASWILLNTDSKKKENNQNLTASVRNLIMGRG